MSDRVETEPDVLAEARRLLVGIVREALELRLLGGAAVYLRTPALLHASLERELQDLDFVASRKHGRATADFLTRSGYAADEAFNMMNGHKRLLFRDLARGRQVDVFVGEFSMCHVIPIVERLSLEPHTLPLAELALTKLQIVKLNHKDIVDLCRLFLCHEVGREDGSAINARRIAEVCSADWGLERTLTLNLEKISGSLAALGLSAADQATVRDRVQFLSHEIGELPKSLRWRLRAALGDRIRWYQEPEEV